MNLLILIWIGGGLCATAAALWLLHRISNGGASGREEPPGEAFSGWYCAPWVGGGWGRLSYGRIGEYVLGDIIIGTSRPMEHEVLAMLPCGYRPKKAECVSWNVRNHDDFIDFYLVFLPDGSVRLRSGSAAGIYKGKFHFEVEEERR